MPVAGPTIGNDGDSTGEQADFIWNDPPAANPSIGNEIEPNPQLSDLDNNDNLPITDPTIGNGGDFAPDFSDLDFVEMPPAIEPTEKPCPHEKIKEKYLNIYNIRRLNDTHHNVIYYYAVICKNCKEEISRFEEAEPEPHEFDSTGVCKVCGYIDYMGQYNSTTDNNQDQNDSCLQGKHTYETVVVGQPKYINLNNIEHSVVTTYYERCTKCGDTTEQKTETKNITHVFDYEGYEDAHPHQFFKRCSACKCALLIPNKYYTVNGTIQNLMDCCVCHGHQYGNSYLENGAWYQKCDNCEKKEKAKPNAVIDDSITLPTVVANQIGDERFNKEWGDISTEAGKMRFELINERNKMDESYTQKIIDYELERMNSVFGKTATTIYEGLTDMRGVISSITQAEYDRQVEVVKEQILISLSMRPASTNNTFYDNIKDEIEVLELFKNMAQVGLESNMAKDFLNAIEAEDFIDSITNDTNYVFNVIGGFVDAVDIYRADAAEKSAYVALLYQYDENMRYLDGLCRCGVGQVEEASIEIKKKLQEAMEGSFNTTNCESATAHLLNIFETLGEIGMDCVVNNCLRAIGHYSAAFQIGSSIGSMITKNTKDQIDYAQSLHDLNNLCSIVGSQISSESSYSLVEFYSSLENSRFDTLEKLLLANGEGTLGFRKKDYSTDIQIIEGEKAEFNAIMDEINKVKIQYTYNAMKGK